MRLRRKLNSSWLELSDGRLVPFLRLTSSWHCYPALTREFSCTLYRPSRGNIGGMIFTGSRRSEVEFTGRRRDETPRAGASQWFD